MAAIPPNLVSLLASKKRIVILGTTGSGKSTLAKQLSRALKLPAVELDEFRHGPNWVTTTDEEFRAKVAAAVASDRWIVDGNYSLARDLIWPRAEVILWLNYSFLRTFWRLLKRTLRRAWSKEVLWNGNQEDWRRSFLSQESILLWAIKSHRRKQIDYPLLFEKPEYAHLNVIELR